MTYLEQIKARADAATEGPWEVDENAKVTPLFPVVVCEKGKKAVCLIGFSKDLQFIAHARADIPWLIEQLHQSISMGGHTCDRPDAGGYCKRCEFLKSFYKDTDDKT